MAITMTAAENIFAVLIYFIGTVENLLTSLRRPRMSSVSHRGHRGHRVSKISFYQTKLLNRRIAENCADTVLSIIEGSRSTKNSPRMNTNKHNFKTSFPEHKFKQSDTDFLTKEKNESIYLDMITRHGEGRPSAILADYRGRCRSRTGYTGNNHLCKFRKPSRNTTQIIGHRLTPINTEKRIKEYSLY